MNVKFYRFIAKGNDKKGGVLYSPKSWPYPIAVDGQEVKNWDYLVVELKDGIYLYDLVKRPEIDIYVLLDYMNISYDKKIADMVQIEIKYKGYINKTKSEVEKMLKLEKKQIPKDIDYD